MTWLASGFYMVLFINLVCVRREKECGRLGWPQIWKHFRIFQAVFTSQNYWLIRCQPRKLTILGLSTEFEEACRYRRGCAQKGIVIQQRFLLVVSLSFGCYWIGPSSFHNVVHNIFYCMSKLSKTYAFPGVLLSLCVEVQSCSRFLYSPFCGRPINSPWQKRLRGWCWLLLLPGGTRLPYRSSIASMATSGLWRDDGSIIWGEMEIPVQTSLVTSWTAFANWDDSISYPPWKSHNT